MSKDAKDEKVSVKETVKKKPKPRKVVKNKEDVLLYNTVRVHVKAIKDKHKKSLKLNEKMSVKQLEKLLDEIHSGKYGKL